MPNDSSLTGTSLPFYQKWRFAWLLAGLGLAAYLPAINNGFIADDYVLLERADTWRSDFTYLFEIPPDALRLHSPAEILLVDFPLNPWIARGTARVVPGWEPHLVRVNEPEETSADCVKMRWNAKTAEYEIW